MKPNSCACYGSNDIHECYCNLNNNNMKPKDEIEKLADNWSLINSDDTMETNSSLNKGYINGYTQCQEDMIEKLEMHILINEDDWNRNPHTQLKDFINSLNKQD